MYVRFGVRMTSKNCETIRPYLFFIFNFLLVMSKLFSNWFIEILRKNYAFHQTYFYTNTSPVQTIFSISIKSPCSSSFPAGTSNISLTEPILKYASKLYFKKFFHIHYEKNQNNNKRTSPLPLF